MLLPLLEKHPDDWASCKKKSATAITILTKVAGYSQRREEKPGKNKKGEGDVRKREGKTRKGTGTKYTTPSRSVNARARSLQETS